MTLMELEAKIKLVADEFVAGINDAKAEMASMQAEMGQLQEDTNKTSTVMQSAFGHALGDFLSDMTQQLIQAAFEFGRGGIELASSMEEVQNVVDKAFGSGSNQVYSWAKTTAQAFGVGELAALQYASTMGSTLTGMGVGQDQIYGMSTALVQLAGDMASFYNLDSKTAFQKIMSGMTGEMEPLKSLGIVMSAANLEAHALSMGIDEAWESMDTATQTLVRYDYLMQQTAMAQGDFANTSGSYANQMRILEENIASLQLTLGEMLLPVMTDIVSFFNNLFGGAQSGEEAISSMGQTLSETYATINDTAENALVLVNALAALEDTSDGTEGWQNSWNSLLAQLSETMPGIDSLINSTTGSVQGGTAALKEYVNQWKTTQQEIAITAALHGAQNEVMQQAQKLVELQADLAYQNLMTQTDAQREESLYAKGREYLGYDASNTDRAPVLIGLAQKSEEGDVYAATLMAELDRIAGREQEIENLESQIAAMEITLAEANAKYVQMEASLRKMQQGDGEGETDGGVMSEATAALQETTAALATLPAEVSNAAREGCAAGVGGITITGTITTGNVQLNTGALVGAITPTLNLKLGTTAMLSSR